VITLVDDTGKRRCHFLSGAKALAIFRELNRYPSPAPWCTTFQERPGWTAGHVERVGRYLHDDTFYANIYACRSYLAVADARPSDAIALALGTGA
jgi:hypothetical protein